MKKVLFAALLLTGCGQQEITRFDSIPGPAGSPGANGHNAVISLLSVAPSCSNGGITVISGTDINDNGSLDLVSDSNIVSQEVCNGVNGTNGTNGLNAPPTAFTPTEIVNPCGDAPNRYDEVFLRLANGMILASFSDNANGTNTRFSVLTAGSYVTTDGDNCSFTLNSAGQISNENHHY